VYPSRQDALRTLSGAVATRLEFNADASLGSPLGTIERPRPERSLRNVAVLVEAVCDPALIPGAPAGPHRVKDTPLSSTGSQS
jgi:hypothetical protein